MRRISSFAGIAFLVGVTGSPGFAAGAVEHGKVAFDVAPDGQRIVFSAADGDLYLFFLDTRHVDRRVVCSSQTQFVSWGDADDGETRERIGSW